MTFFETSGQPTAFLLLLAAGFLSGLAYDALTPFRRAPWARTATDFLWSLTASAACMLALTMSGENQIRLYALLGLACGGGLYYLGLRRALAAAARVLRRTREKRLRRADGQAPSSPPGR